MQSHHFMANRWGNNGNSYRLCFWSSKITADCDCSHEIKRYLLIERKAMTNLDRVLKGSAITLLTKVCLVKAMVFPVVVWMWELDHKKGWELRNSCFQTVVLGMTLESLDSKKFKSVNPKGNQAWIFIGRTDAEVEVPVIWPPNVKSWFIGKDPDAGRRKASGEENDRGWNDWMASLTQCPWIWANSGR